MAVVTSKSAAITTRDSGTQGPGYLAKNIRQAAMGIVSAANGDSVGSKYQFCQIPSNALVSSVLVTAPDIGTTTAMDLGLYQTTQNGGAVVDADFFKAAIVLNAGAISKSESALGNVISPANMEKRIWELLGLSQDPGCMYDVCGTLTGAADAAGAICVEVIYAQ